MSAPTPQKYYVGRRSAMIPCDAGDVDNDPRGIIWVWEPPDPRSTYVMGIDPSEGIAMWSRYARTDSDHQVDNGCIQVVRVGRGSEKPDKQVVEFAAPIDPQDLADVANIIGRVYGGNNEDGQAECIIEVWPGPGLLTQRRMIELGYTNMWRWTYLDGLAPEQSKRSFGWTSSQKTTRDLWLKTSRHMMRGGIEINSPWLAEEMADVKPNKSMMRALARYGYHDDRLSAIMMAIWVANGYSVDVETLIENVRSSATLPDFQNTDCSLESMMEQAEDWFANMMDEEN